MNHLSAVVTRGAILTAALSASFAGCSATPAAPDRADGSPAAKTTSPPQAATAVRYPVEVIGLWVAEGTDCPAPDGEYVGDRILEIQPDRLVGYEEVRTPVKVTRLPNGTSWRIDSVVDVGPSGSFEPDLPATYALDRGAMTVEQNGRTERYRHCPDQ